jgi:hypothetical protein
MGGGHGRGTIWGEFFGPLARVFQVAYVMLNRVLIRVTTSHKIIKKREI